MYSLSFIKMNTGELVQYNESKLREMFLDYWNEFLSVEGYANYYNFTTYEAQSIIKEGRRLHEKHCQDIKQVSNK